MRKILKWTFGENKANQSQSFDFAQDKFSNPANWRINGIRYLYVYYLLLFFYIYSPIAPTADKTHGMVNLRN